MLVDISRRGLSSFAQYYMKVIGGCMPLIWLARSEKGGHAEGAHLNPIFSCIIYILAEDLIK